MPGVPNWLYRGYTGHEMLPEFGLINMNGRMYDPLLGRMLSPDNGVQEPFSTQAYNRYSYAWNNPFKYDDPTGWDDVLTGVSGVGSNPVYSSWSDTGPGGPQMQTVTQGDLSNGCQQDPASGTQTNTANTESCNVNDGVVTNPVVDIIPGSTSPVHNSDGQTILTLTNPTQLIFQSDLPPAAADEMTPTTPSQISSSSGGTDGGLATLSAAAAAATALLAPAEQAVQNDGEPDSRAIGQLGVVVLTTITAAGIYAEAVAKQPYSYVVYSKTQPGTGKTYIGRTAGFGTPQQVLETVLK